MDPTALSYQIRIRMPHDQKFTHDGMFSLYSQIMNLDEFCGLKKMKKKSFERTLRAWVSLDGSWLIKDGRGDKAVYFKREPEDWILKLIERSKDFEQRISDKVRRIISKAA